MEQTLCTIPQGEDKVRTELEGKMSAAALDELVPHKVHLRVSTVSVWMSVQPYSRSQRENSWIEFMSDFTVDFNFDGTKHAS